MWSPARNTRLPEGMVEYWNIGKMGLGFRLVGLMDSERKLQYWVNGKSRLTLKFIIDNIL
jgi:hypothetical protein